MCGIAGLWGPSGTEGELGSRARAMTDALRHRGPDDAGTWVHAEVGLALGHRRLSIVDLSERGHQPMVSTSGRYVITYNGEIFNFLRLRAELEGLGDQFAGGSDTEVLLAAVERWGIRAAVDRFIGMFAFAIWDRSERSLVLVRDRMGVKPLYYGACRGTFFFASELHALRADPAFDRTIDEDSVALLSRFACIPDPSTIYQHARKLPPGCILELRSADQDAQPERYWSVDAVAAQARTRPFTSTDEAREELASIFSDSVGLRMIADVPLGAFLSGGIDSSLVVAWMQKQSTAPVSTFTIGYDERAYDEASDAAAVARHLGTDHHELRVGTRDVQAVIEDLVDVYDEPFADSSQIPTLIVSRFARKHVTVVLTGDGGDELFVGYNRHVWGQRAADMVRRIPLRLRLLGSRALDVSGSGFWDRVSDRVGPLVPSALRVRTPGDKMAKLAALLPSRSSRDVYASLVSSPGRGEALVRGGPHRGGPLEHLSWPRDLSFPEAAALADAKVFLPGDPLVKVDRATMSVGLEARQPLLDHRIAELAWRMPLDYKIRGGVGKWILRELLATAVPRRLFERPKMGFGVPIGAWLREGLRPWAEDLLSAQSLSTTGVFEPRAVRALWQQHQSGHRNYNVELWSVLMTQGWLLRHG
jgi:asparagine synthase (glutamine-hydrolysing)